MLAIDHLMYACADLDAAGRRFADLGLASVDGGRHVGLGTANRIVPLAGCYIELIAVVDAGEAAGNPLAARLAGPDRFVTWMVRTDDIAADAARLGLDPVPMRRIRPDGVEVAWRLAGLTQTGLPGFIQWDVPPELWPSAGGRARLVRLELTGDAAELDRWLGGAQLPVHLTAGEWSVVGATIDLAGHPVTVSST